jgi:hypothetical protein
LRQFTLNASLMLNVSAHRLAVWIALAMLLASAQAASPVHKCVVDGKVTFQNNACANEKPSRQPTVEELNSARKKKLLEAAARVPSASTDSPTSTQSDSRTLEPPSGATRLPASTYRCDGRTHCSQMRSCSEARFFLANCPGVKMDGNRDGTPCEQQWCTHPYAK